MVAFPPERLNRLADFLGSQGVVLAVNIAVVDDGGHLIVFARMDRARPASGATAMTKAVTAATFRQPTGTLPVGGEPDVFLNISIQNAAAAGGGRITTLKGASRPSSAAR